MLLNKEQIIQEATKIEGWFEIFDMQCIINILQQYYEPISLLELGSWKGRSSMCIGLSLPQDSSFTMVDSFLGSENEVPTSHADALQGNKVFDTFLSNYNKLQEFRPDLKLNYFRGDFTEVRPNFSNLTYDIIFIDGNHLFDSVKKDFVNYYDVLKDDGLFLFHDLHMGCPGIVKFACLYFLNNNILLHWPETQSSLWGAKKSTIPETLINDLRRSINE